MLIDTNYQIDWPTLAVTLANLLLLIVNGLSQVMLHQAVSRNQVVVPALPLGSPGNPTPPGPQTPG